MLPYVESLLWGCQKVNIDCVKAFGEFIISTFGADVYSELSKNQQVTDDVSEVLKMSDLSKRIFLNCAWALRPIGTFPF